MISQVEAKYEVLQQAMEMVSTVLDDEEAAEKVAEKIEDIAKDEEVTSDD
jgi:PHD/YefM family antitoxin component YafN of YafNO toxin-antitoxin module